jgi:hypothetical protein
MRLMSTQGRPPSATSMPAQAPRRLWAPACQAFAVLAWVAATPAFAAPAPPAPAAPPAGSAEALHRELDRCAVPNPDECLADLEHTALQQATAEVRREGSTLVVSTQAGPVRFDDTRPATGQAPGYAATERHRYLGRMNEVDAHWVLALPPGAPLEAARYWLVSDAGTPVLALEDLPWPSPGGRLLALARAVAGPRPSVVALYVKAGVRWSLAYRYEAPPGLNYQFRSWRNDAAAVRLEWERTGSARACAMLPGSGSIQLRDGPYGWDLVAPVPASCP